MTDTDKVAREIGAPSIFGYFERPEQTTPTFDPGPSALCPFCLRALAMPVKTISLMKPGDARSYFYRAHKACYETADDRAIAEIESAQIDVGEH